MTALACASLKEITVCVRIRKSDIDAAMCVSQFVVGHDCECTDGCAERSTARCVGGVYFCRVHLPLRVSDLSARRDARGAQRARVAACGETLSLTGVV